METKATDRVKEHVNEIKDAYEQSKQSVRDLTQAAADTSKEALTLSDEWVRTNAWVLLGLTLAVGLLTGLLLSRRSDETRTERVPR
jgi:ElaB/YqjD/DUF883 family membrane-anchored ribosome-binding protein